MVKILLVLEKASDFQSIKGALARYNYDIEMVNNANAIYPAFYNYNPDIVVMDSKINGVDGWAVSRELNEFSMHHSSIVMLNNNDGSQVEMYDSDKVDVLEGSFSAAALLSKINQILQRQSFKDSTGLKSIPMTG